MSFHRWSLLLSLGVALTASPPASSAPVAVLRVCADPNNLPYSNAAGEGFENKIAALLANDMGRELRFAWRKQGRGFVRYGLTEGECDLIMAVPAATFMALTTRPYYRSTFVLVSRPGEPVINSLEDPRLHNLRIGVQLIGDDGMNTPPAHILAQHGNIDNVHGYSVYGDNRKPNPTAPIVNAVADRTIDIAAVWGPIAGYFAHRAAPPLVVTPIATGLIQRLPLAFSISMAVRKTDADLGEEVQKSLARLQPKIDGILDEYHVPRLPIRGVPVAKSRGP